MNQPTFQVFECQNPSCRLRFPSNLSVEQMHICPLCGSTLLASGSPFSNEKTSLPARAHSARRLTLLLDNLRSTLNVGSIFRTADGAGVAHIYCCGTTPTPEHPKIIKTGLGAEGFIPWTYYRNALDVPELTDQRSEIVSLEATSRSVNLFQEVAQIEMTKPVLLILGNEVSGIDPALMQRSHRIVSLPMLGNKSSLNVAVAAGIAMYALRFNSSLQT